MRIVIQFLLQAVTFLTLAKTTLENLDPNKTGWDDEAAKFIDRICEEIKIFIGTHPVEPSTIAKGYAAILAYCNTIIQSMDIVISTPADKESKLTQLRTLRADLDNPEKVYQARSGKDADVLNTARSKADERIERVANS